MATLNLSLFFVSSCVNLFLLLSILKIGDALGRGNSKDSHYLSFKTSSLLPSSICNPSIKGSNKRESSLRLVHKHGPCSQLNHNKPNYPTISQILSQDQSRVSLIQSRISLGSANKNLQADSKVNLPARLDDSLESSNYVVNVGLGTPKKDLSLVIDTGSDLTWTQCKSCPRCYTKKEPMFDPSGSTSYSNITCQSSPCEWDIEVTTALFSCELSSCMYHINYNDKSLSKGTLGEETLTLTSTDVLKGFLFGCGQYNEGLFGKTAGLLGLGRGELSFVSQTVEKYGKYFSYCFPSKSSSTGHLTFGKSGVPSSVKFIPFSYSHGKPYYFIDVTAIYVGGTILPISPMVFSFGGTIIDSGTVITRLPSIAYNMLRETFQQMMINYPRADNLPLLDTCYDLSKYSSMLIPKISFLFNGNVMVDMDQSGILFGENLSQMCLAFSGTNAFSAGIFGNVQQKTLEVVYDVAGGMLGFGAGGCD